MPTYAIGDIHGGLRALKQVLGKIEIKLEDTFIFLGDYVDGWSESAQVIDFLIDFDLKHNCIFIKGNHDEYCRMWLKAELEDSNWLLHGGVETIKSYEGYDDDAKMRHLNFFNRMTNYYIDSMNRLFIHAGFSSMHGPSKEMYDTNFSWDRTLWETALAMDKHIKKDSKFFPKRLLLFSETYIGHTPTINYDIDVPMNKANIWNVDTGAAFYGPLSMLDIETKEYWQSDTLPSLYPLEKGRNK